MLQRKYSKSYFTVRNKNKYFQDRILDFMPFNAMLGDIRKIIFYDQNILKADECVFARFLFQRAKETPT